MTIKLKLKLKLFNWFTYTYAGNFDAFCYLTFNRLFFLWPTKTSTARVYDFDLFIYKCVTRWQYNQRITTHPFGSSSLPRPGRPCRSPLQPPRWGSCREPGRAPQPFWRWRWPPSAPVWASPGLSRTETWSLRWWWGPRWSPALSGSAWSTCRSPSWRSETRHRFLRREGETQFFWMEWRQRNPFS